MTVRASTQAPVTIFLAGDVMTGRGVDQVMKTPSRPELREPYLNDARRYVELVERLHGPLPEVLEPAELWGEGLPLLQRFAPVASLVNLETSVTVSASFWPDKAIHYRMHPSNIGCLQVAHLDLCSLANNHVLDFGRAGLLETLEVLSDAGIQGVGAGRNWREAAMVARHELGPGAQLLVVAVGLTSSGIPAAWAAGPDRPGVHLLGDLSLRTADQLTAEIREIKGPNDIAVVSIHWGSNWGYELEPEQVAFAHRLVDRGIDIVHGHSSHHVRPIEVYSHKLVLYGCGDLVTDYEGIRGHEKWRGDLGAMYFATLSAGDGSLLSLRMAPMQMKKLRLARASREDTEWLADTLQRISLPFGSQFAVEDDVVVLRVRGELVTPKPNREGV